MDRSTDALQSKGFERSIRDSSRTAQEFKARQRASGASGQIGYLVESDQEWDRIETLPTTAQYAYRPVELTLTFTGDPQRPWPIVIPATDIRFNGTGDGNRIFQDANGNYMWKVNNDNIVTMSTIDVIFPESLEDPLHVKFQVLFYYTGTITYYVKARAQASSRGTWSIDRWMLDGVV